MYASSEGLVVKVVGMQVAKQHIQKVVPLRNVHARLFVQIVSQKELTPQDDVQIHGRQLCIFLCSADVREQLRLVEWGVSQREPRFISRAVRNFQSLRKKINERVLWRIVVVYYPPGESLHSHN